MFTWKHNEKNIQSISKRHFYDLYPKFDWKFYIQYNDFVNSKINNEQGAINHYWYLGRNENRRTHQVICKTNISKTSFHDLLGSVQQCYVSDGLYLFKEKFKKHFHLKELDEIEKPCIFFGVYSDKDLEILNSHKGLKYVIYGGEDVNFHKYHCIKTMEEIKGITNIVHISTSKCILHRLLDQNIHSIYLDFNMVDKNIFRPVPKNELGHKILIFNGQILGRESIYGETTYKEVIKKLPQFEYIFSNQLNLPNEKMPQIYKQCFIILRLTMYDGNANSVQECEAMNIPVIHNQSDYGLKWDTCESIINYINKLSPLDIQIEECSETAA